MIIESICNLFISFFTSLLSFVNIPQIPTDILANVNNTIDMMITRATAMIDLVLPYNIAKVLLLIVISVEIGVEIYHFVMWVISKIPMLNIH